MLASLRLRGRAGRRCMHPGGRGCIMGDDRAKPRWADVRWTSGHARRPAAGCGADPRSLVV